MTFFEKIVISIILTSAIIIGISTFSLPVWTEEILYFFDIGITVFFILEITIRIKLEHRYINFFKNGWNIFDFAIVIGSLIPFEDSQLFFLGRLLRIIKLLRIVSFMPELSRMIYILYNAIPKMANILIPLFIIFYIYGAVGSILFSDINRELWGDISLSMLTLFRIFTFEDWTDVMYETMAVYTLSWMYYITFIFLTSFVLINMLIGIVVDEFIGSSEDKLNNRLDKIEGMIKDIKNRMRKDQ